MSSRERIRRAEDGTRAQLNADVDDTRTFEERFQADLKTLKARAWNSDLLAAFRTAKSYIAHEFGDRLHKAYGDEWAKILDRAFEVYAALIDAAAEADETKAVVRRFRLPAWKAQTYLSRTRIPRGLDEEGFRRFSATMGRAWRRYGWGWVHKLQCVTGLALFEYEAVEFKANRKAEAAAYTDHFTDLLTETILRSRLLRSKRVDRFELTFVRCLDKFRIADRVPAYALEWTPTATAATAELSIEVKPENSDPTADVERIARRAARHSAKTVAGLPDAEADALGVASLEWFAEEWEKESGRFLPRRPVYIVADNENSGGTQDQTSRASVQDGHSDFSAESEETLSRNADKRSYGTSAVECVEYEPESRPCGVCLAEAETAANAFASVGIRHVKVVFVDDTKSRQPKDSCQLAEGMCLDEFRRRLPAYIERNSRSPVESMTVRLHFKGETRLFQVDDCDADVLRLLAPFSFLQFATSPGNAQAWLALAGDLVPEEYKRLRSQLLLKLAPTGANGGAYGSARWPGTLNRKPKRRYADGESPRVQLLRVAYGLRVTADELEAARLLAPPPSSPKIETAPVIGTRTPYGWPNMSDFLARAGGDRSRAEMARCVAALGQGWPRANVEAQLSRIGAKAVTRQHDNYVRNTVANAAKWLAHEEAK
jgi:hypothetical protein